MSGRESERKRMSVTFISYRSGDADYTTHTLHSLEGASQSGQTQVVELITINGVTYSMVIDAGTTSTNGLNGWTPVLATHVDGDRTLLRVSDWTGGGGTKPAAGLFIGASGFVADMAQAVSVRGAKGDAGDLAALADGSIAKAKLSTGVQASLDKADASVQDLAGMTVKVVAGTGAQKTAHRDALGLGPIATMTLPEAQSAVSGADKTETLLGLLFRRPLRVGGFGNSIMHLEGSFWQRICALSGGMLYYDRTTNFAVDGENSAMMLGRVLATTAGQIGDVVFLMEGANDASAGVSVATHFANIVASIRGIKQRGGLPVLVSPPPRTDGGSTTNNWVKKYRVADFLAAAQEGVPIIDPWRSVIVATDGGWISGSVNADKVHPTADTHYIAAGAAYAQLRAAGTPVVLTPLCATGEPGLLSNPLIAGSVGSLSGISVYGSGYTATVGAASRGQYLRLTGSGSGVQGTIQMDASAGFAVGDRIAMTAIMRASAIALSDVFLTCQVTPAYSGVATLVRYEKCADGAYQLYAEFVVPSGATGLQFIAQLGQGGAETGYIQVEQVQMYNLTAILA